jgi:hypothetical protein
MQSRSFGQFLLRVAAFIAQPSQRGTESRFYGTDAIMKILAHVQRSVLGLIFLVTRAERIPSLSAPVILQNPGSA